MRIFLLITLALTSVADAGLKLYPIAPSLTGPQASQTLLLERTEYFGDEVRNVGPVTQSITWASGDESIVRVENGVLTPVSNGTARVTGTVEDVVGKAESASVMVTVSGMDEEHAWSFRHHVLPVLSKHGCNMGACHGALAGKGGMKLSLRGYDPVRDHFVLTREAKGRRIELAAPARSLLLTKPTGAVPHKGGLRFEVESGDYNVIAEWIMQGAPAPTDADETLTSLEVLPANVQLAVGQTQPLLVQATYSDGRVEDVTRWAKFTSADETVCKVDAKGEVSVIGYGEGAVTVWFSSQLALARVTSPYANQLSEETFASQPTNNFIDELVLKQLRRLNLPPSPPATDAEFIRRAYLDTIGTLPTPEEVVAFLDDDSADKRVKLVDELLSRPEFVDYWTYKWSDILMINGTLLRPKGVEAYYKWARGHVEKNTPWDEFAREVLTATGSSVENGATNFYALHQTPEDMAENVSQSFLSLSLACAKCHNHPLEKWTNDQYYQFANHFSRVRAKGWGGDTRNGDGVRTLYVSGEGELIQPLSGKPQPPTPLDGEPLAFDDPSDRREHLADWLTSPENPYFARAITNRVWANFFGVGLVEQVDDLRVSNPASNEELLTAAAEYLIENDFDLKQLMRAILLSATYRRSSLPLEGNKEEKRFYSRYYPKRLMAEVLLDAIVDVTSVPESFTSVEFPGADSQKTDFYPQGTRALQLYDSAVGSYFLRAFGRNPRNIVCECERSNEPSMIQVLHLSNGDALNRKLAANESRVTELLAADLSDEQLVERAYLLCYSRRPTESEAQGVLKILAETPKDQKRIAVEDLFWALMTSKEFLFNR